MGWSSKYTPPKFNSKSPWKMMVGEDYLPLGMAKFCHVYSPTLGPQNHEKWRLKPPNIWVITMKNEGFGFPWYLGKWSNLVSFRFFSEVPNAKNLGKFDSHFDSDCLYIFPNQWGKTTLPETNIAPENWPSQKEFHLQTIHFQVLC